MTAGWQVVIISHYFHYLSTHYFWCLTKETEQYVKENNYIVNSAALKTQCMWSHKAGDRTALLRVSLQVQKNAVNVLRLSLWLIKCTIKYTFWVNKFEHLLC